MAKKIVRITVQDVLHSFCLATEKDNFGMYR